MTIANRAVLVTTGGLLAGYGGWHVKSMEEAIEWVKRIPNPEGEHAVVEIRPVFEAEDFGEELTPELREREREIERKLRAQT
jgi:1-acyl-sn-glycerol-3-phosphate acyltransferase